MMKKAITLLTITAWSAILLSACSMPAAPSGQAAVPSEQSSAADSGQDAAAEVSEDAAAAAAEDSAKTAENPAPSSEMQTYTSGYGWSVKYDPAVFEMMESEESVSFYYLDESAGVNTVLISYAAGVSPEELLYSLTMSMTEDSESIIRSEGFFPGTDDKWCFRRVIPASEDTSGLTDTLIAGEFNGAVLVFQILSEITGDDSVDIPASDAVAELINSITYDHFYDQDMFSYYPGTYLAENTEDGGFFVELDADHTGTLHLQDDIDVLWGSAELIPADGSEAYEYDIEGDYLYLHLDDEWISFLKQGSSEASE